MKSKTGIIISIVLLLLLVLLLTAFLITYLITGKSFMISFHGFNAESTSSIFDTVFSLDDVNKISLSQEYGDITIEESSDNSIRLVVYGENADQVDWDLTNQKLELQTKGKKSYFFFPTPKNKIVLYLPTSFVGQVSVKIDCGSCQIEDFLQASFSIDCDAGNVEMGSVKNATVKCDCGNIEIKEITNQCNLRANLGNISIDKLNLQEDSNIRVDMGNITVEETNDIYIDAHVDLGDLNIRQNNRNAPVTLTVNCNCGNITIRD